MYSKKCDVVLKILSWKQQPLVFRDNMGTLNGMIKEKNYNKTNNRKSISWVMSSCFLMLALIAKGLVSFHVLQAIICWSHHFLKILFRQEDNKQDTFRQQFYWNSITFVSCSNIQSSFTTSTPIWPKFFRQGYRVHWHQLAQTFHKQFLTVAKKMWNNGSF